MVVLAIVHSICRENAFVPFSYLAAGHTYEQAPTATTMVLSGVMVKMGSVGNGSDGWRL